LHLANALEIAPSSAAPITRPDADRPSPGEYYDPYLPDRSTDPVVRTTERRLLRLAVLAGDTALRLQREDRNLEAAAWLMTPLELFEGARGIDAAQELMPFARALLLHGLAFGLDADPRTLDDLIAGSDSDDEPRAECPAYEDGFMRGARLFTCYVDGPSGVSGRTIQAMLATMARTEDEVRRRLAVRFGESRAALAEVTAGFEPSHPVAEALISDHLVHLLTYAAINPERAAAANFELSLDLRCLA
jgi:hypothetical protein